MCALSALKVFHLDLCDLCGNKALHPEHMEPLIVVAREEKSKEREEGLKSPITD